MNRNIFKVIYNKNYKTGSIEQDKILLEQVRLYNSRNKWKKIAKVLECIKRFKKINPKIKKGLWTEEEDAEVVRLSKIYGKNWAKISANISNKNKTGKQIRQRYLNFLDPSINRSKFTLEEDIKIMRLYDVYKTNWKYYVKHFNCRSSDMIKGRYYSSVRYNVKILSIAEALKDNKNNYKSKDNDWMSQIEIKELKLVITDLKDNNKNNLIKNTVKSHLNKYNKLIGYYSTNYNYEMSKISIF